MLRATSVLLFLSSLYAMLVAGSSTTDICSRVPVLEVTSTFSNPQTICSWFLSSNRTSDRYSPVNGLTSTAFANACICLYHGTQSSAKTPSASNPGAAPACTNRELLTLRNNFKVKEYVSDFCFYWQRAAWRADAPAFNLNVRGIYDACACGNAPQSAHTTASTTSTSSAKTTVATSFSQVTPASAVKPGATTTPKASGGSSKQSSTLTTLTTSTTSSSSPAVVTSTLSTSAVVTSTLSSSTTAIVTTSLTTPASSVSTNGPVVPVPTSSATTIVTSTAIGTATTTAISTATITTITTATGSGTKTTSTPKTTTTWKFGWFPGGT